MILHFLRGVYAVPVGVITALFLLWSSGWRPAVIAGSVALAVFAVYLLAESRERYEKLPANERGKERFWTAALLWDWLLLGPAAGGIAFAIGGWNVTTMIVVAAVIVVYLPVLTRILRLGHHESIRKSTPAKKQGGD